MAADPTNRSVLITAILLAISLALGACATTDTVDAANRAPVANAGEDTTVAPGDVVNLDGSNSLDPDGDELIYRWELSAPEGSSASLTSSNFVQTSFQPDVPGAYAVTLIVSDGELDSPPDQVTITVAGSGGNLPPTASIAGSPELTASVGVELVLDASGSSDPNDDELTFDWSLDGRPDGSVVDLVSAGGAEARLTPDVAGSYEISLVVNDGELDSAPITVFVLASDNANVPTASAGTDQSVTVGTEVRLDGSQSVGANLDFEWSLVRAPIGSSAALTDADQVSAKFTPDLPGEYEARLVVSSDGVASAPDSVVITATEESGGNGPTADAGADDTAKTNAIVSCDGSASSDPDSDPMTYSWELITVPSGSNATLDSTDMATTMFIPDLAGDYVLELTVTAGGDSDTDTVTISVTGSMPATEGDVIITEFLNDPDNETLQEWFELYNPTDIEWDLNGCVIEDLDLDSVSVSQSVTIAPGEYITLAKSSMPGFTPDYDYGTSFMLANSADEIIVTCGANEVANVAYDTGGIDPFPGSSTISHQLKAAHFDEVENDSAANWCVGTATYGSPVVATGTPGAAPDCN